MDKDLIIKELEKLMHEAYNIRSLINNVIYDEEFTNKNIRKEHYSDLEDACVLIQEPLEWDIQFLIKEIDCNWNVDDYLLRYSGKYRCNRQITEI